MSESNRIAEVHEALSPYVTSRSPALPPPRSVANGRAQPKDRAGSKKHKIGDHQTANTSYHTGTVHRVEKHTSCSASMLTVTHVWVRREKSVEHGLDSVWTAPPLAWGSPEAALLSAPAEGDTGLWIRAQWDWGPVPLQHRLIPAHRPQLVASFKSITVPQTPKEDETSRATRMQKEVWDFLYYFQWRLSVSKDARRVREELLLSIGWHKSIYLYCMYLLFTKWCYFQRVQKHVWISGMTYVIFCKALVSTSFTSHE